MMDCKVLTIEGKEKSSIKLSDDVFTCKASEGVIYHAIRNELANNRVGTASTKTRAEVKGSRRKPWRQKGTGRARAGTRQSPVWVGGGLAFGPRPRDYSYKLPKKMKRFAMKSILSIKMQEEKIKVVEDFKIESGKTRDLVAVLKNLVPDESTVLVLSEDDHMLKRAGKNIPWLKFLSYNRLRAHDLFYGKNVLLMESAAVKLNTFFGEKEQEN